MTRSSRLKRPLILALACGGLLAASPSAFSHGPAAHKGSGAASEAKFIEQETEFGRAIRRSEAQRTIEVNMTDNMRYTPAEIRVRQGEKVRIVVRNSGKVLHEMVLGTRKHLEVHAEQMKKFPNMEHDEPSMAHVDPGKRGEINWQFLHAGEFFYGCLIPGHFEAGMIGRIVVHK